MNEVKFKANKKDLEAIGGQIEEATAALDTTGATAGQVLKVETPGEAPVWGEAGGGGGGTAPLIINVTHDESSNTYTLNATYNQIVSAVESGKNIIAHEGPGHYFMTDYGATPGLESGYMYSVNFTNSQQFSSDDPDTNMTYLQF